MKDLPLRRGQIVTTFGPGSLVVSPEGETAILGGLDKWFYDKYDQKVVSLEDYEVIEPRLKTLLKVKSLLLPPDYRSNFQFKGGGDALRQQNTDVYIPLHRFPRWHYCPNCKSLYELPLSARTSKKDCKQCEGLRTLIQVPFVIVCDYGHISDFPWKEWVHANENTKCEGELKLNFSSGSTLDSWMVICSCGKKRSLKGTMSRDHNDEGDNKNSYLSKWLNNDPENPYECPGTKPWLGSDEKDSCNTFPIAVLKNSVNVYFPSTISAIYLPGGDSTVEEILNLFEKSGVTSSWLETYESMEGKIKFVKRTCPPRIHLFESEDIERAILYVEASDDVLTEDNIDLNIEQGLRRKEFEILLDTINQPSLKVIKEWEKGNDHGSGVKKLFERINRVTKLKETIVLTGFSRLSANKGDLGLNDIIQGRRQLFKNPDKQENSWFPAYKVYGEGIFFTLDKNQITQWEAKVEVSSYFEKFLARVIKNADHIKADELKPSHVLLHTLSHMIINELALTCGYNSASIRERLYLEENQLGALIYTSSGDSDGTFGGLVRMGREHTFFPIIESAVEKARWCSSDPVCSEIGMSSGQGLYKLNGAACHSCAHLPETSCEQGNLFLDRTLLVDDKIGFFN